MPHPALIAAPYRAPRAAVGDQLHDEARAADVTVAGHVTPPIGRWPAYARAVSGELMPIVTGDLARAVRTETLQAVVYWWGVSRATAGRWRRALGVGRFNEGTRAAWVALAPAKLSREARRRGGRAAAALRKRS